MTLVDCTKQRNMEEHMKEYMKLHTDEYYRLIEGSKSGVLFVHCMFGSPKYYNDYIDLVPEDWSIHNVLLVGHGGSVREYGSTTMDDWKKRVYDEFERMCGLYENVYIVSHSLGTLFSIRLAKQHPEKLKGLFLLSTPVRPIVTFRMMKTVAKVIMDLDTTNDKIAQSGKERYSLLMTKNLFDFVWCIPNFISLLKEIFEVRKYIKDVEVPCWAVFSKHDELVRSSAQEYFREVENAKIIMLEHSYHFYYRGNDYTYLQEQFVEFCETIK